MSQKNYKRMRRESEIMMFNNSIHDDLSLINKSNHGSLLEAVNNGCLVMISKDDLQKIIEGEF